MIITALDRARTTSERSLAHVGVDEIRGALLDELPSRVGAIDVDVFVEAALAWLI